MQVVCGEKLLGLNLPDGSGSDGRGRDADGGGEAALDVDLVDGLEVVHLLDVDRLLEQPTPVVGDDGSCPAVLLVGVVAFVEEAALVVGDYVGSEGSRLGRNGDAPGGWLVEGLSEPVKLRLQLLAHRANLGQEQPVVERTHGVVVVDFMVLQDLALISIC